jgi:thiosulfate/3-mercaptopyruvate sulfurtransferase
MRRVLLALFLAGSVARAQGGPQLLLTPAQLNSELRDPRLVLLHIGPREDYAAGHIAGARFVDLASITTPPSHPLPLELPDETTLRQTLESFGVSDNSKVVVVFGSNWVSIGTRLILTLQAAGLGPQTRLLDGGVRGWRRAGLPLTTAEPAPAAPGKLTIAMDRSVIVDHRFMQANTATPKVRLIDARAPMFYEGPSMEMQGRKLDPGHIAGAKNLPFNSLSDDSLQFYPADELRRRFAAAGVQPGDTVAAYCHIGQQATVVLFAARLLGHPVRLYDGSMDDWESRKLPLENAKKPESK